MATLSFPDQLGYSISLHTSPQRIISLVPSQTELLADLGVDQNVVGITKFCIHPSSWRSQKTIVGGTKKFHFDIIDKLKPDLLIGNKEENYQEGIERLREKYPVWMSDIVSLDDALSMIRSVGLITAKEVEAEKISTEILNNFRSIKRYKEHKVLYLIWRKPWMGAGRKTFIDSILAALGLKNALASVDRYPEITEDEIRKLAPAYIFLSSEPYPFNTMHAEEIHRISPESKIMLVDGEMFSWYGSRLKKAPDYFKTLEFD